MNINIQILYLIKVGQRYRETAFGVRASLAVRCDPWRVLWNATDLIYEALGCESSGPCSVAGRRSSDGISFCAFWFRPEPEKRLRCGMAQIE